LNKDSANKPASINNKIIAVNIPPDPVLTKSEVQRTAALLNQLDGINIKTESNMGKVIITGTVNNPSDSKIVSAAFAQIPGVVIVNSTIQIQPPTVTTRIYFDFDQVEVAKSEIPKILQIKLIMDKYPNYQLKIIGHSDRLGNPETNQRIALNRAQVVRDLLVKTGISPRRSQAVGSSESQSTPELSRYVGFELSMVNPK
jgi:outer membrane protein OmpA-like peptidoglycan-associated protein